MSRELYTRKLTDMLPSLAVEPRRLEIDAAVAGVDSDPPPAAAAAIQVVYEVPILWDWRPVIAGMMDRTLFDFCDTIPLSDEDGAPFFSGSESFSDNYRTFIGALDLPPGSPFRSLVSDAVVRAAEPAGDATSTPPGWARVSVNGVDEWRPVWSPQLSPDDWMAEVAAADPAPRTIDFLFDDAAPGPPATTLDALIGASARRVSITARAWGRIPIVPGGWYKGALVHIATGRPLPPWTPSDLFGSTGLLRFRISAFYVASAPTLSMTVAPDDAGKVAGAIGDVAQFVVGGMSFAGGAASVPSELRPSIRTSESGVAIAAMAGTTSPQIVAVVITPVAPTAST